MGVEFALTVALAQAGMSATAAAAAASFIVSATTTALVTAASSFAMSALQGKSGSSSSSSSSSTSPLTQQVQQAITYRRLVFGECRVSGPIVYASGTSNNKYLHMVIPLAAHEVEEIGEVWLDDDSIPTDYLDNDGNVTKGTYAGYVRIKKHLGTSTQTADSNLVSEDTEWTNVGQYMMV